MSVWTEQAFSESELFVCLSVPTKPGNEINFCVLALVLSCDRRFQ